jgi:hypothetical protein
MPEPASPSKLNVQWIRQIRDSFKEFLETTHFPHPVRNGTRGSEFDYPEWLIMLIAIVSVKCKVKSYLGIHHMTRRYWDILAAGLNKPPISESQLRDRLKKIRHSPGNPAGFIFQIFPQAMLSEESQRGQNDDQSQRARLAPKAEEAGYHARPVAWR